MPQTKSTRRDLAALAAGSAVAVAAFAASAAPAEAYQGNMERALRQLQNAHDSLRRATPNKGGHRERAMRLIEDAMAQVQAGIDFAGG